MARKSRTPATFKIEKGEVSKRRGRTSKHAFPWDSLSPGYNFLVPKDYWAAAGGESAKDYKPLLARERIRAHFRSWQSKDASRNKWSLTMATEPEGIRCGIRRAK